jgi:L-2-hydroxyglutarate oxidase
MYQSINKKVFLTAVQKLVPTVQLENLVTSESGVRAQALAANGEIIDDFIIIKRSIHVCNAPSPAATECFSMAERLYSIWKKSKS